jgi:hypothetical protein
MIVWKLLVPDSKRGTRQTDRQTDSEEKNVGNHQIQNNQQSEYTKEILNIEERYSGKSQQPVINDSSTEDMTKPSHGQYIVTNKPQGELGEMS